jgi:hypothetical protein
MGHSQHQKIKTHERIVRTAAKRLREKGLEGVAIADLMEEIGLTVGGSTNTSIPGTICCSKPSGPPPDLGKSNFWRLRQAVRQ